MSVKTWFVNLWTRTSGKITAFFEGPGGVIVRTALGTAIETAGTVGISILLDVAKNKVAALNTTAMTNDSKRIQALDYLKGYALKQGIPASESLLRFTLETAVQAVKGVAPSP